MKLKLDSKTVAEINFTASVTGFFGLSNRESMSILVENIDKLEKEKSVYCFVLSVSVAILFKSEAFYLFHSIFFCCFRRNSSQGTFVLLNFSWFIPPPGKIPHPPVDSPTLFLFPRHH